MSTWQRATPLIGAASIAVLAVTVNAFSGRHYTRWDVTAEKRYELSPATRETLRSLQAPIEVWVLLPAGDPLRLGVRQLLVSYASETQQIQVHYIDPDRDPVGYGDVRRRFGMSEGKSQDGVVAEEAVVVVAEPQAKPNARHWFITPGDMVHVVDAEDARVKPRSERALTGAIRNVIGGEAAQLCFLEDHGELSLDRSGAEGLAALRDLLRRDNYELRSVSLADPGGERALEGCTVAVVAGPRRTWPSRDAERLRSYLLGGGNALITSSPVEGDGETGLSPAGLTRVTAPFGVEFEDALVIELDDGRVLPGSRGVSFLATPQPHAVTAALMPSESSRRPLQILLHSARPLRQTSEAGAVVPTPLLATGGEAYALRSVRGAAGWGDRAPAKGASDLPGPLTLAYASERPKLSPDAPHGPRLVVIGSSAALAEVNWQQDGELRGTARLVESAISWLAATPQVLDVPDKAEVRAGVRFTEETRGEVLRYVLLYLPLAVAALALAVYFKRRSSEGAALQRGPAAASDKE